MGYERDDASGKFHWKDGPGDGEGPVDFGENPPGLKGPRIRWEPWALGAVLVSLLGWWGATAVRNTSESITRIRNHPASFDGRQVRVSGRVGEVFEMGGSCS